MFKYTFLLSFFTQAYAIVDSSGPTVN